MSNINVAGSLIPSTANTPLDARCVVATEADILNISLPYIGMLVYCTGTAKYYKITALGSKSIGALTVENAVVSAYEELLPAEEETAADPVVLIFDIQGIGDDASYSFILDFSSDLTFAEYTTYDSAVTEANAHFKVWGGQEVSEFPTDGIDSVYNGGQVIFTVPVENTALYYRYCFRGETGDTQGSVSSMRFGCLSGRRHMIRFTDLTE